MTRRGESLMIVRDEPCPKCREMGRDKTGNHLIVFDDGGKFCNRCKYREKGGVAVELNNESGYLTFDECQSLPIFGIPRKGIERDTCEAFGVRTEFNGMGEPVRTWYPHHNDKGLAGYKGKSNDKQWSVVGNTREGLLFGQHNVKPGGNLLVLTEGEDDALAVWQQLRASSTLEGWVPSVVSVSHGASGAAGDVARNLEFVDSFKKVVICFDNDEAGKDATNSVAQLIPGKAHVAKLALKDANDMLLAGRGEELKWDILKHARKYQPDGIINGADTWERYHDASNQQCYLYPSTWIELNRMTYGYRLGSLVTITSGTGVGKTQLMRELKYHVWESTDFGIADISLEEDVGDSVSGLMSLRMGQRLHLPDVVREGQLERQAHDELFASGRFMFYDHFGGMDDNNLLGKIRYFAACGCQTIFLDHLSIVISEYAAEGNERERIDTVMTKLAKIAKELNVVIFIVVHLRKVGGGESFEQGAIPTLDDLRGSGTLKQLSWDVIALSRNQQHADLYCRNVSRLTVLKCRFSGRTGPADYLAFDEKTGRMKGVAKPAHYDKEVKRDF
jgi:twinkle protein